jgi:hypothetical protein
MPPRRRNLVFCRVGDDSLHRSWLGDPATRSYDVWLDYYGADERRYAGEGEHLTVARDTRKLPRMSVLAREHPEIGEYDALWFPDDDIQADPATLERLFAFVHERGLLLAQPALAPGSHFTHLVTLQHRGFLARFTNFVEPMVPVFSREAFRACGHTFGESVSGYGLDLVWPGVLGDPRDRIAVVDAAAVLHTRPVGVSSFYAGLAVPPEVENERVARKYGVPLPFEIREYGGLARDGRTLGTGLSFVARLALAPPGRWRRMGYWKRHLRWLRSGRAAARPAPSFHYNAPR